MTHLRLAQFILASLVLWAAILLAVAAFAADYRYCALWAREYVRVGVLMSTDSNVQTADDLYLKWLLNRAYSLCLLEEHDSLALPVSPEASDEAWAKEVQVMLRERLGAAPAQADPTPTKAATPEWVSACKADYRSFREEDGTVIRRGSRKRTPCPHKPPA